MQTYKYGMYQHFQCISYHKFCRVLFEPGKGNYSYFQAHSGLNLALIVPTKDDARDSSEMFQTRQGTQLLQSSKLIIDIATYRLNQPRGRCIENHMKCITR